MNPIKQIWKRSKIFRVLLIIAVIYAGLRLAVQGAYLAFMLAPEHMGGNMPEWAGADEPVIPNDLNDYLEAAQRLHARDALYLEGDLGKVEFFQYAPSYALVFTIFLSLSPAGLVFVHTLMHLIAYVFLYIKWGHIFDKLELTPAGEMLAWTLPVWLLFSSFWTDLGYLNIYIIMALIGTLFIEAVLKENFIASLLLLSVILQMKPQWAFAMAVPLFLGRFRFFIKLSVSAVIAYMAIIGITLLVVGPAYGWQQYTEYVRFLAEMPAHFPWRGPGEPYLGYNHSVKQVVLYFLGVSPATMRLATVVKLCLLVPLGGVSLLHLLHPYGKPGYQIPLLALDFAFALYLGAFIWLDMVWELSLSIAIFPYLLGTLEEKWERVTVLLVFLAYALLDPIRVLGAGLYALGFDVIGTGLYILIDPAIYIPLMLFVMLVFYALLIKRLWGARLVPQLTLEGAG